MKTPHKQQNFTHHILSDKEKKNLTILELIRKKGPISRSEIAKDTSINIVSISNYINDYIGKNIIIEKGFDVSSGGRRPELVEINSKGIYTIGLEIGVSNLIATMTDLGMNVLKKVKKPRTKGDEKEVAAESADLVQELITMSKVEQDKIKTIGLGMSEANFSSKIKIIKERFKIDAFIGSTAACAAFGEKRLNPQADVENLLYIYSDIGYGVIIKENIYFGAEEENTLANEYLYLKPWSSGLRIAETAKREITRGIGTKMVALAHGDTDNVTENVVIEAAKENDEIALYIIQNTGLNLGIRIAYLINLFDPEVVVIGGGIEKAGELVLDPIRKMAKKFAFRKQSDKVKVIAGALGEDAVSLGAAALAIREIFLKA